MSGYARCPRWSGSATSPRGRLPKGRASAESGIRLRGPGDVAVAAVVVELPGLAALGVDQELGVLGPGDEPAAVRRPGREGAVLAEVAELARRGGAVDRQQVEVPGDVVGEG